MSLQIWSCRYTNASRNASTEKTTSQTIHTNGNVSFTIMEDFASSFFAFSCICVLQMETETTEKDRALRTSWPRNRLVYLPGQVLCGNFARNCGLFNRRITVWQVCLFVCLFISLFVGMLWTYHYYAKDRFYVSLYILAWPRVFTTTNTHTSLTLQKCLEDKSWLIRFADNRSEPIIWLFFCERPQ